MEQNDKIVLFQERQIRRVWYNDEWYFAINDIILILTDSKDPKQYFNKLRKRDTELERGVQIVHPLSIETTQGKQTTNCANTKGILRIIQSIPSPKAEPFKRWMAEVGQQTLNEIQDPELGFDRLREIYRTKGYPEQWIIERMQSIDIRKKLTDEWKNRGVKEGPEYSILTAIIAKGTFGLTPTEHKDLKGLTKPNQNLRDHMTDLELVLTALGEAVTRTVAIEEDAQGFDENKTAAVKGGQAGGQARRNVEKITGKKVVSSENHLKPPKPIDTLPESTESKD